MIHRVMGSNLAWRIGDGRRLSLHFGFHRHGHCWKLFELPSRSRYFRGKVTWYHWWRFYLAIDTTGKTAFAKLASD